MASKSLGTILTRLTRHANGQVAHISISRQSKLNALNTHLLNLLPATINEVTTRHADLLAIILTGDGPNSFIGGADIAEMSTLSSPASARAFITRIHVASKAIRECAVPVIARVNGYALGAGCAIAASCDFRVASTNAVFGMPEVRVGVPSVVESALFPGLIGWGKTRRLLMLGEKINAGEALQWGLVEKVVPSEKLDEAVREWIKELEATGPKAVRSQKELIRKWELAGIDGGVKMGIDHFGRAFEVDGVDGKSEPERMMGEFVRKQEQRSRGAKL